METRPTRSRFECTRSRAASLRARGERLAEQAQEARKRHGSVDAAFEVVDRDAEVGGGIIAGALAYRFFIWLLPLVLVLVAGLGVAADASSRSPEETASTIGFGGMITSSVANAADSPAHWYALVVGIAVLVFATRRFLRVLIGAHRLVWRDVRAAAPKPTPKATLRFLALLLCFPTLSAVAGAAGERSTWLGLVVTVLLTLPYAGLWLLITVRLSHWGASWTALVPGALLMEVGIGVFQVVTAVFIAPWAIAKQGTYGVLGGAAALLLGFFLLSRLMVGTALLNATLWERRERTT